jgi:hypothetical protein
MTGPSGNVISRRYDYREHNKPDSAKINLRAQ